MRSAGALGVSALLEEGWLVGDVSQPVFAMPVKNTSANIDISMEQCFNGFNLLEGRGKAMCCLFSLPLMQTVIKRLRR